MWEPEHRKAACRKGLRYDSDMTDAEWAFVAPLVPPAKRGGRKREGDVLEIFNAIFYVLWTGCQWKALPKNLPPKSTGSLVLHAVALGRHAGAGASCFVCSRARTRRTRGQPHSGDHRQPECQERVQRGGISRFPRLRRGQKGQRP